MDKQGADIVGNALRDYWSGKQDAIIKVHSDIADPEKMVIKQFFRDYEAMPDIEKTALNLCRGKVVDLGAGAGSHALVLQEKKNLEVTGIDISKGACAVMSQRGVKEVRQKNIFDLGTDQFDTILMLMNGIGLVGDLDGLTYFFQNIKKNLKPGAQIIADSSDISYMFYDEEGYLNLNLNAEYHGVVTYQMAYNKLKGQPFKWLFIDFPLLQDYAAAEGYHCEFIQEDEHYHYLAKITLKE